MMMLIKTQNHRDSHPSGTMPSHLSALRMTTLTIAGATGQTASRELKARGKLCHLVVAKDLVPGVEIPHYPNNEILRRKEHAEPLGSVWDLRLRRSTPQNNVGPQGGNSPLVPRKPAARRPSRPSGPWLAARTGCETARIAPTYIWGSFSGVGCTPCPDDHKNIRSSLLPIRSRVTLSLSRSIS